MFDNKLLENTIKLYKEEKITKYVLEKELSHAVEGVTPVRVFIDDEDKTTANHTFLAYVLPRKLENGNITLEYHIGNNTIKSYDNEEEIVELLITISRCSQKAISTMTRFMLSKKDVDISMRDCLTLMIALYKIGIQNIEAKKSFVKFFLNGLVPDSIKLDDAIERVETGTERIDEVIEWLNVSNLLPAGLIKAARRIVTGVEEEKEETVENKVFQASLEALENAGFKDPEEAVMNREYKEYARASKDPFNGLVSQEIPYDYKPETNQ